MDLYLLSFNNYHNRQLRKFNTLTDYLNVKYYCATQSNINFDYADGIDTAQVVNFTDLQTDKGDYVVIAEGNEIKSRWYVLECKKIRGKQYRLELHRDVLADNWEKIKEAPFYCEKGIVLNSDPAIYNDENIVVNQIKKKETLLKDESECPWIVGYYSRDDQSLTINSKVLNKDYFDVVVNGISTWSYYNYSTTTPTGRPTQYYLSYPDSLSCQVNAAIQVIGDNGNEYFHLEYVDDFESTYSVNRTNLTTTNKPEFFFTRNGYNAGLSKSLSNFNDYKEQLRTAVKNGVFSYHTLAEDIDLRNLNNKILKDSATSSFYKVHIKSENLPLGDTQAKNSAVDLLVREIMTKNNDNITAVITSADYRAPTIIYNGIRYYIYLEILSRGGVSATVQKSNKQHLTDSPYDAFAIPYSDDFTVVVNNSTFKTRRDVALAAVYDLISQGVLMDAQLLPFAPFGLTESKRYTATNTSEYELIKTSDGTGSGVNANIMIFIPFSNINKSIECKINIDNTKIDNLTKFCRLNSPNYNGSFEFVPAMNDGVDYFNVDMTIKPYNPYIHINPNFKGLYGASSFNNITDARGLICNGDFSLPSVLDEWKTYQTQNKNFRDIYEREVENMKVKQRYEKMSDIISAATGTGAGFAIGAKLGGVPGAIIGTALSAGAGIADVGINEKLREEELDYKHDMFELNNGNIQARPNILNKVSSYNINNKYFPFVEYYDCTDIERTGVINKIKYNGMTINRIGRIIDFVNNWSATYNSETITVDHPYIKGLLIRTDSIGDNHLIESLTEELNKGVFVWE